ncbi:MAG: cell division protein ZapA [Bacillota bacterium]|jgi:cell division protein ZapA
MTDKACIRVRINGYPYTLRGEGTDEDLQKIADLVSKKVEDIKAQAPHTSANHLAMMTALQLAEDFLKLQKEYLQLKQETELLLQE